MMTGQKNMQGQESGWERAKVIAMIIDAITRAADILLRR